jgi:hypothetical protein
VRKLCQGFSHLADSREEGRKRITNFEVRMWEISLNPMGNGIIRKQRRGLRVMAERHSWDVTATYEDTGMSRVIHSFARR